MEPIRTAQYTWAALDETLGDEADITALSEQVEALADDPARLFLRLTLRGRLPLAARQQADERLRRRLEGALFALDLDDTDLLPEPTADDLDAIDRPGGVLRLAAEHLQSLAADDAADPEAAATARRALARLYIEARAAQA